MAPLAFGSTDILDVERGGIKVAVNIDEEESEDSDWSLVFDDSGDEILCEVDECIQRPEI